MSIPLSKIAKTLIDKYGYYFYIVKRIPNIKCQCVNPTTTSPDPKCKRCLGTGNKIIIEKVYGSIREPKDRESGASGRMTVTFKVIYLRGKVRVSKDDIVIDDENIYRIFTSQFHKGEAGEFAFTRLTCPYTKESSAHIIRNFKELLDEYKLRKNKQ